MLLVGVNFYDEDINFQSSDRPQFLTHTKCQRVQAEAPVFACKGFAIDRKPVVAFVGLWLII